MGWKLERGRKKGEGKRKNGVEERNDEGWRSVDGVCEKMEEKNYSFLRWVSGPKTGRVREVTFWSNRLSLSIELYQGCVHLLCGLLLSLPFELIISSFFWTFHLILPFAHPPSFFILSLPPHLFLPHPFFLNCRCQQQVRDLSLLPHLAVDSSLFWNRINNNNKKTESLPRVKKEERSPVLQRLSGSGESKVWRPPRPHLLSFFSTFLNKPWWWCLVPGW